MTVARWALMQAVVAETVDKAQISEAAATVWELELDVAVRMAVGETTVPTTSTHRGGAQGESSFRGRGPA